VHAHLVMAALAPALLAQFALLCLAAGRRPALADVRAAVAGGLAVPALLRLVNHLSGGDFLFFVPALRYARTPSKQSNPCHNALPQWLPQATYLAYAAMTLAACLFTWALGRPWAGRDGRRRALTVAALQGPFVFAALVSAYLQVVKKQTVLDHSYPAA